jgi:hypothetical protein
MTNGDPPYAQGEDPDPEFDHLLGEFFRIKQELDENLAKGDGLRRNLDDTIEKMRKTRTLFRRAALGCLK